MRHVFPADGEYELSARLFRGVEEGYIGVEGNGPAATTFVITIDGEEVFTADDRRSEGSRGRASRSITEVAARCSTRG